MWKPIFYGRYALSSGGIVIRIAPERGTRPGHVLKPHNGYVRLANGREQYYAKVEDLVREHFHG